MSAPHIRAALEAAALAGDKAATFYVRPVGPCLANPEAVAAAAIAAFLRNYAGMWQSCQGGYLLPDDAHDLAAAVEQEATRDG